jgi:hypothetical protein
VQDSRQFEVDVHISGGALLRISFPQGPQLQSMVRVLLNYLDMHLIGLTALNASEGSNIYLAIHITEMRTVAHALSTK